MSGVLFCVDEGANLWYACAEQRGKGQPRKGQQIVNASKAVNGKPTGSGRPADECPFRRPFPPGFDQCPTFRPQTFTPLDMSGRSLAPMLTCGELVTRSLPNGKFGWYAACKLGDEAARRKLAEVRVS
jgi:hypothetical protein